MSDLLLETMRGLCLVLSALSVLAQDTPVLPPVLEGGPVLSGGETSSSGGVIAIPEESPDSPPLPETSREESESSEEEDSSERSDIDTSNVENSEESPEPSDSTFRTDACTEAMTTLCKLGDSYTFEESLRCLESHVTELEGACSIALNVMMTNLYTDCSDAVSSLCPYTSTSGSESVYVLTCLSNHESELSADCQQQLDTYLNEEYPCTKEATKFCSNKKSTSPERTLECLETILDTSPEDISLECATVLDGFSSCKGDDNRVPGPKPKPRAASSRLLASDSENYAGEYFKPKPKPKPKPPPDGGDGLECWKGNWRNRDDNDGGLLSAYDNLFGSKSDASDDNGGVSSGIVVSTLLVAFALLGIAVFKYQQSQDDIATNGGYWRAPSIQAMLFDDSTNGGVDDSNNRNSFVGNRNGRPVIGQVVEMDDMTKSDTGPRPSVEAIQITVSPIASDEIRV